MVLISRKEADTIQIGCDITVRVMRAADGLVLLGVEAPPGTPVVRAELIETRNAKPSSTVGPLWEQDLSSLLFPNDRERQASGLRAVREDALDRVADKRSLELQHQYWETMQNAETD